MFRNAFMPGNRAKPAWIVVAQHRAVCKHNVHMVVFVGMFNPCIATRKDTQTARHAQMNQQNARFKTDNQIFCPPTAAQYLLLLQDLRQVRIDLPAQPGLAQHDIRHLFALDVRGDTSQSRFHLRQFRHFFILKLMQSTSHGPWRGRSEIPYFGWRLPGAC